MKERLHFRCVDVQVSAAAWLDGQLSPAEAEFMEEHLQNCSKCEGFIATLAEQDFEAPDIKIAQDDHFWQDMDQILEDEFVLVEKERSNLPWPMLALYAATLLLSLLWGLQHRQRAVHLEKIVENQQHSLEYWEKLSQQNVQKEGEETVRPVKYVPARMEL